MGTRIHLAAAAWLCATALTLALPAQTKEQLHAMAERRIALHQPMPEWLAVLAGDDPDESVRRRAFFQLTPTRRVDAMLAILARHDDTEWFGQSDPFDLSAADRWRLVAGALVRARELLAVDATRNRGMTVLDWIVFWSDRGTIAGLAPELAPHLALSPDPIATSAWLTARSALEIDPNGALREPVLALAVQALGDDQPLRQDASASPSSLPRGGCGLSPGPSPGSLALRAADRCADQRLFAPLLARTMDPVQGDDEICVLDSWVFLTPKLDADAARKLHTLLLPRLEGRKSFWESVGHALYASAPDDLMPWFRRWLANARDRHECASLLDALNVELPRDRLLFLFDGPGTEPPLNIGASMQFLRCPELVRREWNAGRWRPRDYASLAMIEAGVPREVIAPVLDFPFVGACEPLAKLALVAPYPCSGLEHAVARATVGTMDGDVKALRRLFTCDTVDIARAVALRALRLGNEGQALVQEVLMAASTTETQAVGIVSALLEARVAVPDLKIALARITSGHHRQIVTAAELRFLDRDPTTVGPDLQAIAIAGLELDASHLRAVLATTPDPTTTLLQWLSDANAWSTPTTLANALTLAADAPTEQLPIGTAMAATRHPHAAVRAAAYRILQRLDRSQHPEGWLAAEAEFDPDPTVRAVATK